MTPVQIDDLQPQGAGRRIVHLDHGLRARQTAVLEVRRRIGLCASPQHLAGVDGGCLRQPEHVAVCAGGDARDVLGRQERQQPACVLHPADHRHPASGGADSDGLDRPTAGPRPSPNDGDRRADPADGTSHAGSKRDHVAPADVDRLVDPFLRGVGSGVDNAIRSTHQHGTARTGLFFGHVHTGLCLFTARAVKKGAQRDSGLFLSDGRHHRRDRYF